MTACAQACGSPMHPPSLIQIRKRYAVEWNDLALVVESEPNSWTARIQTLADRKVLYQAQRGSANAAKAAGVEFAMFHAGGAAVPASPEKLSLSLVWREQW